MKIHTKLTVIVVLVVAYMYNNNNNMYRNKFLSVTVIQYKYNNISFIYFEVCFFSFRSVSMMVVINLSRKAVS